MAAKGRRFDRPFGWLRALSLSKRLKALSLSKGKERKDPEGSVRKAVPQSREGKANARGGLALAEIGIGGAGRLYSSP